MIASEAELGLGNGHDGIVVLSEWGLDPEPGTDVLELLNLHDEAAEINVTPDRGYVLSMRGVAREYGHATRTEFTDPAEAIQVPAPNDRGWPCASPMTLPCTATPAQAGLLPAASTTSIRPRPA